MRSRSVWPSSSWLLVTYLPLTEQRMLHARSPGGQLHLLAGGVFLVEAGAVSPPLLVFVVSVFPVVLVPGRVVRRMGACAVADADAVPVDGGAAADEVSAGVAAAVAVGSTVC